MLKKTILFTSSIALVGLLLFATACKKDKVEPLSVHPSATKPVDNENPQSHPNMDLVSWPIVVYGPECTPPAGGIKCCSQTNQTPCMTFNSDGSSELPNITVSYVNNIGNPVSMAGNVTNFVVDPLEIYMDIPDSNFSLRYFNGVLSHN